MPTSSYMPDVVVEIAFDSGVRTPAASRTWTDVSAYVELDKGITINWGRQDESSTADSNNLSLTLDNRDGRFTAGKAGGAYYPNVKVGRPIRVRADPVDGADSVRFMGFIDGWPTEWDVTDAYASAAITATSRLSRLGTQAGLKSLVESTILADSPAAYYTLGEPEGATQANDSSGNKVDPLTLAGDPTYPLVFGTATGPGTDGLTAVQFTPTNVFGVSAQHLTGSSVTVAGNGFSLETFFLRDTTLITNEIIAYIPGLAWLTMSSTGNLQARTAAGSSGSVVITSASSYTDNSIHHVALTITNGGTWEMYVDGASVGSSGSGAPGAGTYSLQVGWASVAAPDFLANFGGVVAHVAAYNTVLSSTRAAAHSDAGRTGYAGETTSARLIRYAALAGIPSAEVAAETGSTAVQHIDTTDKQVVELMRIAETTEAGVLYDERDGTLTFHNRAHRYTAASAYTLNMAEGEVEAGYAPRFDASGLVNDVSAQDISGVYTAHVFDATSILDNGLATGSIETASQDKDQPLDLANWNLYESKDPKERAPNLEVDALAQVGKTPNCSAVLATTVGTKVTVSNRPTQASTSTIDYFAEGGSEVYSHESLKLTFNVSPSAPYDFVLVIDDATRGVIDTNVIGL